MVMKTSDKCYHQDSHIDTRHNAIRELMLSLLIKSHERVYFPVRNTWV